MVDLSAVDFQAYEADRFRDFDKKLEGRSMMHSTERFFLHGLLRYFRPRKILELGVADGGGTALILNAVADLPDSRLFSVDAMYHLITRKPPLDVGWFAAENFPDSGGRWSLHVGSRCEDVLDEIGGGFDFVVMDTMHVMPGEVLDFLSILPYAADGCVFVLHDLNLEITDRLLKAEKRNNGEVYCCKQLFSAVKAEKFYPVRLPEADFYDETSLFYLKHLENIALPNIGAFRSGPETAVESAVRDVFSLLPTVWTRQLDYPAFVRLSKWLRRHYPGRLVDVFEIAYNFNRLMRHGVKLEAAAPGGGQD